MRTSIGIATVALACAVATNARASAEGDAKRLAELERENRELRRANEILRTTSAFFAAAELDRKTK